VSRQESIPWAYLRAISERDFTEQHLAVILFVLRHQFRPDRPSQLKAYLPLKRYRLADLAGFKDAGDFSRAVTFLTDQSVIEIEGDFWWLRPPSGPPPWTAPMRRKMTSEWISWRDWLEQLDPLQPDLIEPPMTLQDALLETFVESQQRRVESSRVEGPQGPDSTSPPSWNPSRRAEPAAPDFVGKNPMSGAVGNSPIGNFPTECNRGIERESITRGTRGSEDSTRQNEPEYSSSSQKAFMDSNRRAAALDNQAYVEEVLRRHVKGELDGGRSRDHWWRCIRLIGQDVVSLVAELEDNLRTRRPGDRFRIENPAAWLNRKTYEKLQARRERELGKSQAQKAAAI